MTRLYITYRSIAALLVVMMLAAACGGATPTNTPVAPPVSGQPTSAGGAAQPAGEITFQVFGDPEEVAVFEAVVNGYKEAGGQVKVNLNAVPSQGEYMTKLSASLSAGNPPDVFLLNYRRYGQFLGKNAIEPAEKWIAQSDKVKKDDFFETALQVFSYNGELQCVPQNLSSMVVYYNKDLFEQNHVPLPHENWTWQEFLGAATALTKDTNGDGVPDIHGLGVEPSIIRAAPFIWQNGGRLVDDEINPTRTTLDEPEARSALQFFVNLNLLYRVTPNEAEAKAQDWDSRFEEGKLAMTLNSRRVVPVFRSIKGFTWDVAPPPVGKKKTSVLHSDAYCMAAAAKNKEATWNFVEYAIGTEGQKIASKLGRTVPSNKSIANSDAFLDPSQAPASSEVFLDESQFAILPILGPWPAMERVINEELEAAFYGVKTLDDAIKTANEKATAEMNR